jgi:hypothetical protein
LEQSNSNSHWLKSRYALVGGLVLVIAIVATGWWSNRPPETIFMEGAVVINDPGHYTVIEDGSCLGTRTGYSGEGEVVIELDSGEGTPSSWKRARWTEARAAWSSLAMSLCPTPTPPTWDDTRP